MNSFRILSLAGGGVRGLFQIHYLNRLARIGDPLLYKRFDLIAGTSIGAINGLMISLAVPTEEALRLFESTVEELFRPRRLRGNIFGKAVLKGGIYQQTHLKNSLKTQFGDKTLDDCHTHFIGTSASVSGFHSRLFSNHKDDPDRKRLAVDVALASSAAPTYFDPHKIESLNQSFLDGGVWANSPSLPAVLYAHFKLGVPLHAIRVLAVGTGQNPSGETDRAIRKIRPVSKRAIEAVLELMFASQKHFYEGSTRSLIGSENYIPVDFILKREIRLDDARSAKEKLPGLAEEQLRQTVDLVDRLFPANSSTRKADYQGGRLATTEMLMKSGLSRIIPSRRFYPIFRPGEANISDYISSAKTSLWMVSINLRSGLSIEQITAVFEEKLLQEGTFEIVVSMLNPRQSDLLRSINASLDTKENVLAEEIEENLQKMLRFRRTLPHKAQVRFDLRVHNTLPFASAIVLDGSTGEGRIQLETKAYKEPMANSFALEVMNIREGVLFNSLLRGYKELMKDGTSLTKGEGVISTFFDSGFEHEN